MTISSVSFIGTLYLRCCAEGCHFEKLFIGDDYREAADQAGSEGWHIRLSAELCWCPSHGRHFDERQADVDRYAAQQSTT